MYGATAGEVGILRTEASTNQAVCGIFPNEKYIPEYLYYFFLSHKDKLVAQAVGNAQPNISQQKIKNTDVDLPRKEEQKRIVAILDQAFAEIDKARANAEQNLKNARELFDSYLEQVFSQSDDSYTKRDMTEICEINSKLIDPNEDEYKKLHHIGAGNIISNTGGLIGVKTAEEEGLKSGKFVFDDNVVLYSKIRPYLMKVCRPNFNGLCSADIYPLVPIDDVINKDYLYYLLLSKPFTDYAIAGSARAGMPKVNRNHLFSYTVTLPDITTQVSLVSKLDTISEKSQDLTLIYEKKIQDLDELKKSILQKAFSGELTNNEGQAA